MRWSVLLVALSIWPAASMAGLTETQLSQVTLSPPPRAQVPVALVFQDLNGRDVTLGDAIAGRPTLLVPADFTCTQICGPALSIAASALAQAGLQAGRDYSLVVVGIDTKDNIEDARRFTSGQVGGPGVSVLSGNDASIRSLMASIGYSFQRDVTNGAIAHPAAYVTLAADGRVSRVLSSLALRPTDLKLALIEAGDGRIGGLTGRIALLCYGFDAIHGIYTRQIAAVLEIGGALTIFLLVSALGMMFWRSAKREASS